MILYESVTVYIQHNTHFKSFIYKYLLNTIV